MILLIDNYDSFVHNLARYLRELLGDSGCPVDVLRNDVVTVADIEQLEPQAIVISPGPCTPREAGISVPLVQQLSQQVPMLGVCLGHQAMAAAFGGQIVTARLPVHGRTSPVHHDGEGLFEGLPNPLTAARYHSLVVAEDSLDASWEVTARSPDGIVMAMAHQRRLAWGVQFHPESILTESGHRLLWNFLVLASVVSGECPVAREATKGTDERYWNGATRSTFPDLENPQDSSFVLHW